MAEYNVNKGIGRSPEFKGLKSQYLFVFAGGLLALFVVFVIMYMAGIGQWVCIGFGVIAASVLVWATFRMNAKYGEWGLMKLQALRRHPRYIINRRKFLRLFSLTSKKEAYEKCNENSNAGKQIPVALGGRRINKKQGRGHYRGLQGGAA